jgi:L-threonylcarbamoyladenylate synthase
MRDNVASPGGPLLSVGEAVERLQQAAVIAYPTEAVYGLGCDPRSETAVREILRLKGRPEEAGLILIADRFDRFRPFAAVVDEALLDRALAAWPGPVTWLFPRAPDVPDWLAGSHPTIALRVTAHPVCRSLCAAFGSALVSTSANPRSDPPARSAARVAQYFGNALGGIVEGDLGSDPRPSEIRDLASGRVIRAG